MNKDIFKFGKLSGRGTAALLCLSLAAASAVGIYSYNKAQLAAEKQITGTSDAAVAEENVVDVQAVQKNVPEKRNGSCRTIPMLRRRCSVRISSSATPPIVMRPFPSSSG